MTTKNFVTAGPAADRTVASQCHAEVAGPWGIYLEGEVAVSIEGADGTVICDVYGPATARNANAARIVACVNYCEGMPTADLMDTRLLTLLDTAQRFQRERDELLAIVKQSLEGEFCGAEPATTSDGCYTDSPYERLARAAIAKLEQP